MKLKSWLKISEKNRTIFMLMSIILFELIWFVPFVVVCTIKYGMLGTLPISYIFVFTFLMLLSLFLGFKFSMKVLFSK